MTWTIEGQEPWYVEHPTSPSVTSVGIAKDGVIKAVAVSTTLEDEGDYIVAALNAYEAESPRHQMVVADKVERAAQAMWFDYVDQQGYPNGLPTWDEMSGLGRGDRREEFRSMARAALSAEVEG